MGCIQFTILLCRHVKRPVLVGQHDLSQKYSREKYYLGYCEPGGSVIDGLDIGFGIQDRRSSKVSQRLEFLWSLCFACILFTVAVVRPMSEKNEKKLALQSRGSHSEASSLGEQIESKAVRTTKVGLEAVA